MHPATVIKAGPCVVVQAKTTQADGYDAVQIGLVEERPARVNKPLAGHYKKADVPPTRVRREVAVKGDGDAPKAGDQVLASIFQNGERVDVIATSRGRGFQGVMRRHNFAGGAGSHGSMFHRAPGSIGASSYPSRVVKGMRMAATPAPTVSRRGTSRCCAWTPTTTCCSSRGGARRTERARRDSQGGRRQARTEAAAREGPEGQGRGEGEEIVTRRQAEAAGCRPSG